MVVRTDKMQEARKGRIDLSSEDEDALNNLIGFCYGKISDYDWEEGLSDLQLAFLYELALRLDVKVCAALAGHHYEMSALLPNDCDEFVKLVAIAYETPADDRTLLDPLLEALGNAARHHGWEDYRERIEAAVARTPSFAVDLLIAREPPRDEREEASGDDSDDESDHESDNESDEDAV